MLMRTISIPAILLSAVIAVPAAAQTTSPQDKPAQAEARPTGLPAGITWTFNFDAGWGTFGFANSLYDNPKEPGVEENLSDQWFEGYVKPALSGAYTTESSGDDLRQGERCRRAHLRFGAGGFRERRLIVRS